MADRYPEVPTDQLQAGGWRELARTEETLFQTPMAAVIGRTLVYEDEGLQTALSRVGADDLLARLQDRADGDDDGVLVDTGSDGSAWRFFFATRLSFTPPLAPGIGPASMRTTVESEARRSFAEDLQTRGFRDVTRGRGQRYRTGTGDRARLTKFDATLPLDAVADGCDPLEVEGWLSVWHTGESFRIAGGAYPVRGLDPLLADRDPDQRPATGPRDFRTELLDLLRAVE